MTSTLNSISSANGDLSSQLTIMNKIKLLQKRCLQWIDLFTERIYLVEYLKNFENFYI